MVVLYIRKIAHKFKNVANRYNLPAVFSAPYELAGLCPRIFKPWRASTCGEKHTSTNVDCSMGVVYKIPLSCLVVVGFTLATLVGV